MVTDFSRLSEEAEQAVRLSLEASITLGHDFLGTEHLFLGLLRVEEGFAGQALRDAGVNLEDARAGVERIVGRGEFFVSGARNWTPHMIAVMAFADDEATEAGTDYVGTDHILSAILRDGEGVAIDAIQSFGLRSEDIQSSLNQVRSQFGTETRPQPAATSDRPSVPSTASGEQARMEDSANRGEPTRIVRDAILLQLAITRIEEAKAALEEFEGRGIETALIENLVLPELESVLAALNLETDVIEELLNARRDAWRAQTFINRALKAFRQAGETAIVEVLVRAALELVQAVPPL